MRRGQLLLAAFTVGLLAASGVRAAEPGTSEWDRMQSDSARDRVAIDALARAHGGSSGGCTKLPSGWAAFDVTINFPAEYHGYPGWVNSAILLPESADAQAYAKGGGQPTGAIVRPALRAGAMAVHAPMCALAGKTYWLVVDSGRERIVIGRLQIAKRPASAFTMTAPPLRR